MILKKTSEVLGYSIEAELRTQGKDVLVEIKGGCAPHIGCVSVCRFEEGEMRMEKLLLPGHRDDVVADRFAEAFARQLHTTVCAVCGIHYDNASRDDIVRIVGATEEMLRSMQHELSPGKLASK